MNVNSDLPELLRALREDLDVELKGWMDPKDDVTKAKFAKELIALRNHGGGFLVIGFLDTTPPAPDPARPDTLAAFNTDYFNNVLKRYAEPVFHCSVDIVAHPTTGEKFPIVTVPGGATSPVRCKSESPDGGKSIRLNSYYIRRPGPESNTPQSGAEWDALINRCILARKQELASMLSSILSSGQGPAAGLLVQAPTIDSFAPLKAFSVHAMSRFDELRKVLPADDSARLEHGFFQFSARILGVEKQLTLGQLRDALTMLRRYTGWSPMYVFTREALEPYAASDDVLECWLGRESKEPGHADFWQVSTLGFASLIRGYQEDEAPLAQKFGKAMDLTVPAWRLAEFLLRVRELGARIAGPEFRMQIVATWTGLQGRRLVSVDGSRLLDDGFVSKSDTYEARDEFDAKDLDNLPGAIVGKLVAPLLRRYSLFEPPAGFFEAEIAKMTGNV